MNDAPKPFPAAINASTVVQLIPQASLNKSGSLRAEGKRRFALNCAEHNTVTPGKHASEEAIRHQHPNKRQIRFSQKTISAWGARIFLSK
jgi:hypothetical protein